MGLWMAGTFGIICPKPLYLGLLVYVAVIGSAAYGALALGAYGLGLATTVAVSGLVLMRARRAARFSAWMAAREEGFHLVQGLVFAGLGAMAIAFFWLRYTIPPSSSFRSEIFFLVFVSSSLSCPALMPSCALSPSDFAAPFALSRKLMSRLPVGSSLVPSR